MRARPARWRSRRVGLSPDLSAPRVARLHVEQPDPDPRFHPTTHLNVAELNEAPAHRVLPANGRFEAIYWPNLVGLFELAASASPEVLTSDATRSVRLEVEFNCVKRKRRPDVIGHGIYAKPQVHRSRPGLRRAGAG